MRKPHWERGYRCWGYWLDNERLGFIGLIPRLPGKKTKFLCSIDIIPYPYSKPVEKETLKEAKRYVEGVVHEKLNSGGQ